MKKNSSRTDPFDENLETGRSEHYISVPGRANDRRQKLKRGGCVSGLAGSGMIGNKTTSLTIPGEKAFMRAALAGKSSSFLAGKATTSLAGGAVTSLAGKPGTSLLILTKKDIPKGTIIKGTDLEGFLVSEPVKDLDKSIIKEDPVGRVAKDDIPAHRLIASVVLAGTPSTSVTDIKLPPGATHVIRAKNKIPKGSVIQEADLDVDVISSPIKSPDMYVSKDDLVGKVAKETIPKNRIMKKYMVK
jgi:hypothetical protein